MTRTFKEVRIFVASPSDVIADREKVISVIKDVDHDIANDKGFHLNPITWENVSPDMGRPEQVILDQVCMGDIQIFVGLMGMKFGSPTGKYESGTAEEFHVAYEEWKRKGTPRIMFYFNMSANEKPTREEMRQYEKVLDFKEKTGLFKEYGRIEELVAQFRSDLINIISNWSSKSRPDISPAPEDQTAECEYYEIWRDAFSDSRQAGERVESCLYRSARDTVKFMTVSGRSIFSGDVEEALKSRDADFRLRILLFDWNSKVFAAKMRDERRTEEPEIERARTKAKDIARQFCNLGQQCEFDLQIRLYSEYPVWRILVVDNSVAYVGYYPKNKRGYEGPMFIYRRDSERSLFYPMMQYFDKVWAASGESLTPEDSRLL